MPLIESGLGLRRADEIAEGPRVRALQLGEIDLAADLGLPPHPHRDDLAPLRSTIVVASAAAGLQPPVGAVSPQLHDIDAFRATTTRLKLAGFLGRAAIHPAQVPVIHEIFSISPDELAAARATVSHYESHWRRAKVRQRTARDRWSTKRPCAPVAGSSPSPPLADSQNERNEP